jgi:hypothetical protein
LRYTAFRGTGRYCIGKLVPEIGIIDARIAVGPQVDHIMAPLRQHRGQFGLQRERGMVRGDGDAQGR